jgi:DNA repair protein RAD50
MEKERLEKALRMHESDLHSMQLRESELKSQVKDRANLEKQVVQMKSEVSTTSSHLKVSRICVKHSEWLTVLQEIESKIEAAQNPIKKLDDEYKQIQEDFSQKIAEAQQLSQELNMSVDKLDNFNKLIDR